jgi:hypothetical protein
MGSIHTHTHKYIYTCVCGGGAACVPRRKISLPPSTLFVTVLVGKVEVRYRVIHLTVKPACNPISLNCIYARRKNVRTIIIEKQHSIL